MMDEIKALSYEAAYAELEAIVARLEAGEQSLEDSVNLYDRGQKLAAHCQALLEKAELQVKTLDDARLME